ncbi:hypothetical protein [Ruegeria atlantica]|uniref:Uncharacterized protein n=1 Tax=Ruegeria atlantica TaxID=81569 RepID=A0A0P1E492_9RHOB|nr:hypothetical protein [Ruegeria atlantica]CUH42064.1 hypothetical protein RUM4293_00949 [Ruegeria atlantica]
MGKRSEFPRIPRDKYPTPTAAIDPLLQWIEPDWTFAEPAAGNGQLARYLEENGHRCLHMSDIEPEHPRVKQLDACEYVHDPRIDCIITNPPWSRPLLHRMITHLSDQAPTWLLFDSDWVHTKQAAEFMPRLRQIVSIGRVKWFPETNMTGKDNCCWHLFTRPGLQMPTFVGRQHAA